MKVFLIRVAGLTESPHSWRKVPFETTYVKKVEKDFYRNNPDSIRREFELNGYKVLWIHELFRKLI